MSDVDITMSADSRAVLRAMAAVEKSVTQIGNKVVDLSQKSDKLNKTFQNGAGNAEKMFGSVGNRLAGMAAGAFSVNSIISQMIQSGQDFSQKGIEAARSWDMVWREFAGQSELRGSALDEAEKRVRKIAQEVGMDLEQSVQAATQLVSSGFSAQEASGGSLREFLKGIIGSNVAGRKDIDPKLLAMSASSYLSAQGMDKTSQNLREVMQRVQGLYKATNIQLQDFNDFSRESAALKGILDIPTQLGAFAALKDVMSSEESATGLRNVVQRMRTAGGTKEKTEGLAMLGLKPSDVDMVGEDFLQSLQKLSDGLKRVAPEKQDIALKKIFEERGLAIAKILVSSIEKVDDYVKKQIEQAKQYEKDVQFGGEGINAAERRQKAERDKFFKESGQDKQELYMAELAQYQREKGFTPLQIATTHSTINALRYTTGMSAEDSAKAVLQKAYLPGVGEFGGYDSLSRRDFAAVRRRRDVKLTGEKMDNQQIAESVGMEPVRKTPARIEADSSNTLPPQQRHEEEMRKKFGPNWWVPGTQEKFEKQEKAKEAERQKQWDQLQWGPNAKAPKSPLEIGPRIAMVHRQVEPVRKFQEQPQLNEDQRRQIRQGITQGADLLAGLFDKNRGLISETLFGKKERRETVRDVLSPAGNNRSPAPSNVTSDKSTILLQESLDKNTEALNRNTEATKGNTSKQGDKPAADKRQATYRPTTRNLSGEMTS